MTSDAISAQQASVYARVAGILFLLSMFGGGVGEFYVPSQMIVSGDAAATARNITENEFLFRFGFAAYLIEAVCDIALSLVFYVLLRPVHKELALLAAFFGLVSTSVFAIGEIFYFAALILLKDASYLKTFSPEQRQTLAYLGIRMYGTVTAAFMLFYGIASILRGYLMFRSGYLPKFLGVLLAVAGASFVVRSSLFVLAPSYASSAFLFPAFLAGFSLTVWFLVKGLDAAKWNDRSR